LLGHKRIQTKLKYTQLVEFIDQDEYVCKAARTTEDAKELIESGFEYVPARAILIKPLYQRTLKLDMCFAVFT
jgi:hypothetical protein